MLSRILAFRPASVVGRLPARSDACPLSLKDLLVSAPKARFVSIEAGSAEVVGGVLVAAKVLHASVGLSLPRGENPTPWFDALARTADELAAALPIFLSAEVVLSGPEPRAVERALLESWRLVEAGLTHLCFDATRLPRAERARALAEVAAPAKECGIAVDVALSTGEEGGGQGVLRLLEELRGLHVSPDLVSVRCPAPPGMEAARAQVAALEALGRALGEMPVYRRGPLTKALLSAVLTSTLRGCDDGGLVAASGGGEAAAFAEALDLLEALGAAQGAPAVVRGLAAERSGDGG